MRPGLPLLDAVEQELVAVGVIHQLRPLAFLAAVVFVTEAADVAEGVLDVEGLGFRRGAFVGVCGRSQSTGAEHAGGQREQTKSVRRDVHLTILLDWKGAAGRRSELRSVASQLAYRTCQQKKGGDDSPPFLETVLQFERSDQGSANTFSTPESFGMLLNGSPHRSP